MDSVTKAFAYPLIPASCNVGSPPSSIERADEIPGWSTNPTIDEEGYYRFPQLLTAARFGELSDRLCTQQQVLDKTGGADAAGLFAVGEGPGSEPELLVVREDVGRHNSGDKGIGWAIANVGLRLPRTVLQFSACASFELAQKSAMEGIPRMPAVSAPSGLVIDSSKSVGVTVIGFSRKRHFNAYSYPEQVIRFPNG